MPIRATLLQEISSVLGAALPPSLTTANDVWDIYEAYILTLVIRAAQAEGAQISYETVQGAIPTTFVFRTSPGHIYSTSQSYCHAVLTFTNKPPLEVHMSVRVAGMSKVLHECDVCVIRQDEAAMCRNAPVPRPDPRSNKVLIAVECKFYGNPLSIGLGRAFIGLTDDLSVKQAFLVYNIDSPTVETFLTERGKDWEHRVVPTNTKEVERLKNHLQSAFQRYISGNR